MIGGGEEGARGGDGEGGPGGVETGGGIELSRQILTGGENGEVVEVVAGPEAGGNGLLQGGEEGHGGCIGKMVREVVTRAI